MPSNVVVVGNSAGMRRTATLLFVQGRSMRETAEATKKSLHRIRCDRATLQTLARVPGLNED